MGGYILELAQSGHTEWVHRVGVCKLEWAHGKFQNAFLSGHRVGVCILELQQSGYTEWVCVYLSGHTASFIMPY